MADVPSASSAPDLSTPKATAVLGGDFNAFQREQRAEERAEGATPVSDDKPAASSPATAVNDPPASTDATPKAASEPAKPAGHKGNADTRVQELLADRAAERLRAERLERELADLRAKASPDAKPASSADPDPEPDPANTALYPEGQFDRKFLKDQARWEARQEIAARDKVTQQEQRELAQQRAHAERTQRFQTQVTAAKAKWDAAKAADPTVFDAISPDLLALQPSITLRPGERATFGHAVADVLLQSDDPVALARHLSDPAEQQRLSTLSPDAFYREIGRIEARLSTPAAPAPVSSKTPAPPPTLGRKPTVLVDDVQSAVADGDFTRFQSAMRQRDRAARA